MDLLKIGFEAIDLPEMGFEPVSFISFFLAEAEHGYASLPPTFELDSPAVVSLVNGTKVRDVYLPLISTSFYIIFTQIKADFPHNYGGSFA